MNVGAVLVTPAHTTQELEVPVLSHSTPQTSPVTEKRCTKCGTIKPLSEFYPRASSADGRRNDCKDCRRSASRIYGALHRDERNAYGKQHYEANRERRQNWQRAYEQEHKDTSRVQHRAWYEANLDAARRAGVIRATEWAKKHPERALMKARRNGHVRRARERSLFVESVDLLVVFERDNWRCGICGKKVKPKDASLDHIIPLAQGGKHEYANVQCAHKRCNFSKGARGSGQLRLLP
jgi:5-methylcytosine-specific restriction endonuclease McrA